MNEKSREVVRVCYYPVDGLFIHVFGTKLTGEVVHVDVTQANPAMPVLESSLHTLYF